MAEWQEVGPEQAAERPGHAGSLASVRSRRVIASPSEAAVGTGPAGGADAAARHTRPRRTLRHALASRQALRQAILLHEILGTPKALQPPGHEFSHPPNG